MGSLNPDVRRPLRHGSSCVITVFSFGQLRRAVRFFGAGCFKSLFEVSGSFRVKVVFAGNSIDATGRAFKPAALFRFKICRQTTCITFQVWKVIYR